MIKPTYTPATRNANLTPWAAIEFAHAAVQYQLAIDEIGRAVEMAVTMALAETGPDYEALITSTIIERAVARVRDERFRVSGQDREPVLR